MYTHNFLVDKGVTFRVNLLLSNISGRPMDTTGWNAKFQVTSKRDRSLVTELNVANGGIVFTGSKLTLYLSALKTALLVEGVYDASLYVVRTVDEVDALVQGTFAVNRGML